MDTSVRNSLETLLHISYPLLKDYPDNRPQWSATTHQSGYALVQESKNGGPAVRVWVGIRGDCPLRRGR